MDSVALYLLFKPLDILREGLYDGYTFREIKRMDFINTYKIPQRAELFAIFKNHSVP